MHVVKALPFHSNGRHAQASIHYISRREERLPGGARSETYGLGARYRQVGGKHAEPRSRETAFRELFAGDATRFRKPVYHHHVFTVDERVARQLVVRPRAEADRALRDVLGKAFRGSAKGRDLQGLYAIHWHGAPGRVAHPHIHVVYSPVTAQGRRAYVGPKDLERLKATWNREVDRAIGPPRDPGKDRRPGLRQGAVAGRASRAPRSRPAPETRPAATAATSIRAFFRARQSLERPAVAATRILTRAVARELPVLDAGVQVSGWARALLREPVRTIIRTVASELLRAALPPAPRAVAQAVSRALGPSPER